jgi:1-acyl-sn-glycerol-3-phosphate acyltransferase
MIRTIIWFVFFWCSLISYLPEYLIVKNYNSEDRQFEAAYRKANKWSRLLLKIAGTTIEVEGKDLIPEKGPILFIANHQSNFDIPLMISAIPTRKGFIAKRELEKMPMVSGWMRYLKCIFMDRSDIRQQVKAINIGASFIKEGYPLVLFPEGTRSDDGSLKTFKAGGLKLATKSGATIVPVTIDGSINIMQKGTLLIKPAAVKMTIHPPYVMNGKDTSENMMAIKHMIASALH